MAQELAIADNSQLVRNQRTKPLRVTNAVRKAIEAMVYDAADYQTAATIGGISTYRLRVALSKPHVAALLKSELQVLRQSRSPKNFHRLCEIADAENNMPAVNAIKALEQINDDARQSAPVAAQGAVSIRIVNVINQTNQSEGHIEPVCPQP